MKLDPETTFDGYYGVPEHLRDGLVRYVNDHDEVGHFLTSVLENDLRGAIMYGDIEATAGIPPMVRWLYNRVPSGCWGSPEAVKAWLKARVVT